MSKIYRNFTIFGLFVVLATVATSAFAGDELQPSGVDDTATAYNCNGGGIFVASDCLRSCATTARHQKKSDFYE